MNEIKYALSNRALRSLVFFALSLAFIQVNAATTVQVANDVAFGRFLLINAGAGQQVLSYGSAGIPLSAPTPSTLATDGGSYLRNTRTGSISNPSGNPVTVIGNAKYSGARLAPLLGKALKLIPVLGTGVALYDLAREVGHDPLKNPDGSITYRKQDPTACTVAPCYEYYVSNDYSSPPTEIYSSTPTGACQADAARRDGMKLYGFSWTYSSNTASLCYITAGSYLMNYQIIPRSVAPSSSAFVPSTEQELADAIALKSGWPTSSALAQAAADALSVTGETLTPDSLTVTGPATSTGPAKTVVNPDGSKTVSTPTYSHTYNNNTISTVTTTTINNYDSSNVLTGTTTQTETPTPQKTDCEIDPSRVGCAQLDVPDGEVPKSTKNITFSPSNLGFGGGTCPADKFITVHRMAQPVKVFDWQGTCGKLQSYARPMILSLATFAALMIIFSFKVES